MRALWILHPGRVLMDVSLRERERQREIERGRDIQGHFNIKKQAEHAGKTSEEKIFKCVCMYPVTF